MKKMKEMKEMKKMKEMKEMKKMKEIKEMKEMKENDVIKLKTLFICLCVKNVYKYLISIFKNLDLIVNNFYKNNYFTNIEIIFSYDKSIDNTLLLCKIFKDKCELKYNLKITNINSNINNFVKITIIELKTEGLTDYRTWNISRARNAYMNYILQYFNNLYTINNINNNNNNNNNINNNNINNNNNNNINNINNKKNHINNSYMIVMDADDVCSNEINLNILNNVFIDNNVHIDNNVFIDNNMYIDNNVYIDNNIKLNTNYNWDAISFSSIYNNKEYYYDIWAYLDNLIIQHCWGFQPRNKCINYINKLRNRIEILIKKTKTKKNNNYLEVDSAFGGFAIYRLEKFINSKYNGSNYYLPSNKSVNNFNHNLTYNEINNINHNVNKFINKEINKEVNTLNKLNLIYTNEVCEHLNFHIETKYKNKALIYIYCCPIFNLY